MMGDILLRFNCCIAQQPQAKRRRRLDPSMIGLPQDFRHTGHIGSSDVGNSSYVSTLQTQMRSKGGFEQISGVHIQQSYIDVQPAGAS